MTWNYDAYAWLPGKKLFWKEDADLRFLCVIETNCSLWGGPDNWFHFQPGEAFVRGDNAELHEMRERHPGLAPQYMQDRLPYCVFDLKQFRPLDNKAFIVQRSLVGPSYPTDPAQWVPLVYVQIGDLHAELRPHAVIHARTRFDYYLMQTLWRNWPDFEPRYWSTLTSTRYQSKLRRMRRELYYSVQDKEAARKKNKK